MRGDLPRRLTALALAAALGGCTVSAGESPGNAAVASTDAEALRPGERVRVTVEGQPDLSGRYELDRDGRIEVPLLGAVDAHARTTDELADRLVARLADGYLHDPRVEVARLGARPFFILGEVARPGSYPYRPGMTVADAVATAGGALGEGEVAAVLTPAGRARDAGRVAFDAALDPGDIVELADPRG
ncbi:MAG: polysaccharide export protein [Alphaproteobacteria bacterium]|nr:polysaccharide export protein [Alphaproteobacteria bacterium]